MIKTSLFLHTPIIKIVRCVCGPEGQIHRSKQTILSVGTWAKIASEWLPSTNYELAEALEISFTGDLSDKNNVYSEIWIAVKKKDEH